MISKTHQDFLVGAVVGGVVGAVTALAFTPLSGAALRRQMVEGMHIFNGAEKRKTPTAKNTHAVHKKAKASAVKAKTEKAKLPRKAAKARVSVQTAHHGEKGHAAH